MNTNNSTNNEIKQIASFDDMEQFLEREKQHNKTEIWSKLDKTQKIQKLHAFAEKYGKDHKHTERDIRNLKGFFIQWLEKGKLNKTKDVMYDKEKKDITGIPSLFFDMTRAEHNFTLRNTDPKRVSTLKSLTPKRISSMDSLVGKDVVSNRPEQESIATTL